VAIKVGQDLIDLVGHHLVRRIGEHQIHRIRGAGEEHRRHRAAAYRRTG